MENNMFREEQPRGWMFGGSVLGTVVIGLVLAGMAAYYFRALPAPPPVVIQSAPEIRYVERPAPPPPPPKVAVRPPPRPAPPPPRPAKIEAVQSEWNGVWRKEKNSLPMFQLKQVGNSIVGKYAPGWSGVFPFRDGRIVDNTVEFVATDGVFRAHFRMTMLEPNRATVEGCVTDEDWLSGLEKANRMVRTPQQALLARTILQNAARQKGKWTNMGDYVRSPSDLNP